MAAVNDLGGSFWKAAPLTLLDKLQVVQVSSKPSKPKVPGALPWSGTAILTDCWNKKQYVVLS